jgi:hypothetical protein
MLQVMPEIGAALQQQMPWVPFDKPIYLIMDNAGGHGMEAAIERYTSDLLVQYNVEIVHQAPRSPETNVLDLGLWRSIQSWSEQQHHNKTTLADTLAVSVNEAWEHLPVQTIYNVFSKVLEVLRIIVDDEGRNDRVEERRGRHHRCHAAEEEAGD